MLCQPTVGILLMRRLHLRHYMRRDRRITQLIRRLKLCQLTVDMLSMCRLHLRHNMRQRRRRINQRICGQLHKIHIRGSIRCRIISSSTNGTRRSRELGILWTLCLISCGYNYSGYPYPVGTTNTGAIADNKDWFVNRRYY